MSFIREKRIYCGDYLEVDIIPRGRTEIPKGRRRARKKKVSAPKQKRLNDKNAKRYFTQLVNTNFGGEDYHVTLTYSKDQLPPTREDAERGVKNYINRINYRRKKEGLDLLKYILITEGGNPKKDGTLTRIHHHIIMDGLLEREVIEDLWSRRRKRGEKEGKRIGYVNARRLQPDEYGLKALSLYLVKNPAGKKRWSSSQNLESPYYAENNHKYTKRKVERLAKNIEDREYWENEYKGYWLTESKAVYNELTGWSIYLQMRKGDG